MGGPGKIDGKYVNEIDNFLPCIFEVNGIQYPTAEHYFQCVKTITKEDHEIIRNYGSALNAWLAGGKVLLRGDWEVVKVDEMYIGNKAKFEQNPELAKALYDTKGKIYFMGSTDFWNYWNGIIMQRIRAELRRNDEEGDFKMIEEMSILMENYKNEQQKIPEVKLKNI